MISKTNILESKETTSKHMHTCNPIRFITRSRTVGDDLPITSRLARDSSPYHFPSLTIRMLTK